MMKGRARCPAMHERGSPCAYLVGKLEQPQAGCRCDRNSGRRGVQGAAAFLAVGHPTSEDAGIDSGARRSGPFGTGGLRGQDAVRMNVQFIGTG